MYIRFNNIDKAHNGIRRFALFDYGWFDKICDTIRYLISEESGIMDGINHNFGKIRIDSHNYILIEKILTFHNVIILITSIVNKDKN